MKKTYISPVVRTHEVGTVQMMAVSGDNQARLYSSSDNGDGDAGGSLGNQDKGWDDDSNWNW